MTFKNKAKKCCFPVIQMYKMALDDIPPPTCLLVFPTRMALINYKNWHFSGPFCKKRDAKFEWFILETEHQHTHPQSPNVRIEIQGNGVQRVSNIDLWYSFLKLRFFFLSDFFCFGSVMLKCKPIYFRGIFLSFFF